MGCVTQAQTTTFNSRSTKLYIVLSISKYEISSMYKPAFPTGSKDITDITTNCTFLLEMFSTFKITQHSEQNFEIYWSCFVLSVHKKIYFLNNKSRFLSFWNSFQTLEWLGADCDQMQCNQIKSAKFKWKKVLTLWKKSFPIVQEICSPFLKNQFEIFEFRIISCSQTIPIK